MSGKQEEPSPGNMSAATLSMLTGGVGVTRWERNLRNCLEMN